MHKNYMLSMKIFLKKKWNKLTLTLTEVAEQERAICVLIGEFSRQQWEQGRMALHLKRPRSHFCSSSASSSSEQGQGALGFELQQVKPIPIPGFSSSSCLGRERLRPHYVVMPPLAFLPLHQWLQENASQCHSQDKLSEPAVAKEKTFSFWSFEFL